MVVGALDVGGLVAGVLIVEVTCFATVAGMGAAAAGAGEVDSCTTPIAGSPAGAAISRTEMVGGSGGGAPGRKKITPAMSPAWRIIDTAMPPANRGFAAALTYLISSASITKPTLVTPLARMIDSSCASHAIRLL